MTDRLVQLDAATVAHASGWTGNGADLLDETAVFVRRYVVVTDEQAIAIALWIAHTYALEAADATPYLSIGSAVKRSGKTRLLETLELLVARPWLTGRVTAAVLVRKVDAESPTLLLDESDAAFKGETEYAEALRGILNSGHRRGGKASLCVGPASKIEYRDFSVFGAKAIAGIGKLPDTIADRCIRIDLKRQSPAERVERFRRRDVEAAAAVLRPRLARFVEEHAEDLARARPSIPEQLDDRAMDGWEPLLAIADAAGGDWPERARMTALALSGDETRGDESIAVQLLRDVRLVFDERDVDRLASAELIEALATDAESPWVDWRGRGTITPRALATLLGRFHIRSRTIRLPSGDTPKGYLRDQFEDVWERYVAPLPPSQTATTPQAAWEAGLRPVSIRHRDPHVADAEEASNPHDSADVADVAFRNAEDRPEDDFDLLDDFVPEAGT